MARGRRRSTPRNQGFGVLLIIVGCASFGLGMLNPALRAKSTSTLAPQVKTQIRALADGTDLGQLAWVGLNDPSIDQSAQFVSRVHQALASPPQGREAAAGIQGRPGLLRFARNDMSKGY